MACASDNRRVPSESTLPSLPLRLFLPCAAGIEALLQAEVKRISPASAILSGSQRGGVSLMGSADTIMRLNLQSRLTQRVLIELSHAPYRTEHDIYQTALGVDWESWFEPARTIKVEVTAQHSPLKSLNFAALRVKDAICDRLRDEVGDRPSVDTHKPDIRVYTHLTADTVTVYLDTSGEPLFKRGWRQITGEAPLKETLAAAMLAACDWEGAVSRGLPLYDPCCGSGTIAIEAAQIACRIAPGLNRFFAFEQFIGFDTKAWEAIRAEAFGLIRKSPVAIYASDVAHRMVDFAKQNAAEAGPGGIVSQAVEFRGGDALERMPPAPAGVLLLNPPYGERIETGGFAKHAPDGVDFFARLASHWKNNFAGWSAFVLSPDLKLPSTMRLKESKRTPMWNGPIECRLFKFEMRAGSFER